MVPSVSTILNNPCGLDLNFLSQKCVDLVVFEDSAVPFFCYKLHEAEEAREVSFTIFYDNGFDQLPELGEVSVEVGVACLGGEVGDVDLVEGLGGGEAAFDLEEGEGVGEVVGGVEDVENGGIVGRAEADDGLEGVEGFEVVFILFEG